MTFFMKLYFALVYYFLTGCIRLKVQESIRYCHKYGHRMPEHVRIMHYWDTQYQVNITARSEQWPHGCPPGLRPRVLAHRHVGQVTPSNTIRRSDVNDDLTLPLLVTSPAGLKSPANITRHAWL